jgi:cupin fold WbuC family metalloprotein
MQLVDADLLRRLSEEARSNPRLRKNHNLHASDHSSAHRLLNAIEPGSYIPPHRHLDPEKDESFVILAGRLAVFTFDDSGAVQQRVVLAAGDQLIADIPHGVWHTALALAPGTVFFEAKAGPYLPLVPEEKAPWAPADGTAEVAPYLEGLRRQVGC